MIELINNKIKHLKTLLESIESIIDINVYIDGRTYTQINLKTGELSYTYIVTTSCGCCSELESSDCNINDLSESSQIEILFGIDTNTLLTK